MRPPVQCLGSSASKLVAPISDRNSGRPEFAPLLGAPPPVNPFFRVPSSSLPQRRSQDFVVVVGSVWLVRHVSLPPFQGAPRSFPRSSVPSLAAPPRAQDVIQQIRMVENYDKDKAMMALMQEAGLTRRDSYGKALVFANTKRMCEQLSNTMYRQGISCASIHGDKDDGWSMAP